MQAPDLLPIEEQLFALSMESIRLFAEAHQDESFYGFGIDCNAEMGIFLLCFNSEAAFAGTAREYVDRFNYDAARLAQLKTNFGDWKYQGFNQDQPHWDAGWGAFQEAIEAYLTDDAMEVEPANLYIERLMRCACRVLVRIERSGILERTRMDPGFTTLVMDHDQDHQEATVRLNTVRAES
ncbi:hypothetical protein CR152_31610 [Massilia violaceinigra]|uniref:DUF4303 domain-containing protein n=1 Tax=Massilia violaceinigra TaxID=2045208 RepID=A0A2D2DUA4_9BURK|nr:DUF4303 domain-containing protein [Massilia violaceinigra]ATQ78558.1 hypothetical protein CR152_31610 [Massilia violaceinigra]